MLVDECGGANVGWGAPHGIRAGWSTPGGGCRNSTMSFTGSVPSLHPAGSIRSLRSQHSQVPETPRRCMYCHPMQIGTPSHYVPHTPVHYYTPSHCVAPGQNGTYTPHRGSSYHGDPRVRCLDVDENLGDNTNWVLGDLRTLHRCVPALRRTGIDVAGIQTHFYPEGGWGWLVCAAGFLALLLTTGMQLAFGLLHLQAVRHLGDIHLMDIDNSTFIIDDKFKMAMLDIIKGFIRDIRRVIIFVPTDGTTVEQIYDEIGSIVKTLTSLEASAKTSLRKKTMVSLPPITIKFSSMLIVFTKGNTISVKTAFVDTSWIGALSAAVSRGSAPLVVGASRRGSTRLTAVIGGFVLALASLFTSFALQMHQVLLSYGLVLGAGAGLVRESAELVLGHYFKKRREFVEMVMQAGTGVGIALFSVFYKEALTKLGWRLGLQSITGALSLTFFLGLIYRSAALYHPQRSAIVHLKNQRPKVKEKRTNADSPRRPLVDLSPLHNRPVRMLMLAAAAAGFGLYSPAFYIALQGHKDGLEPSALVLLQTCLGLAAALGCAAWGIVTARPSTQCFVSRQYLCQAALLGVAVAQIALGSVEGYHGLVLASGLYGASLGGALYSLKMLAFERLRRRNFARSWALVQAAEAVPILLGVPLTGYMNASVPRVGYYACTLSSLCGAALLFLVGWGHQPPSPLLRASQLSHVSQQLPPPCACPPPPRPRLPKSQSLHVSLDVDRDMRNLQHKQYHQQQHQQQQQQQQQQQNLLNLPQQTPQHHQHQKQFLDTSERVCPHSVEHYCQSGSYHNPLRPSKSVPEGLSNHHEGTFRPRPRRYRDVTVIEQITTSV